MFSGAPKRHRQSNLENGSESSKTVERRGGERLPGLGACLPPSLGSLLEATTALSVASQRSTHRASPFIGAVC